MIEINKENVLEIYKSKNEMEQTMLNAEAIMHNTPNANVYADNPDYDDLMEYVLYLENKIIQQLEDQLIFMYIISAE